jgi:hypothetical protein
MLESGSPFVLHAIHDPKKLRLFVLSHDPLPSDGSVPSEIAAMRELPPAHLSPRASTVATEIGAFMPSLPAQTGHASSR